MGNGRFASAAACALVVAGSVATEANAVESIERYCTASWRQARIAQQDWQDCTQQVLLRLLDRLSREGLAEAIQANESAERRELNRAIWATTKRWQRARRPQSLGELDPPEFRLPQDPQSAELRRLIDATVVLSDRQREILQQTIDGASVREIADALALAPARVSDDKYKAIAKLRRLVADGVANSASERFVS